MPGPAAGSGASDPVEALVLRPLGNLSYARQATLAVDSVVVPVPGRGRAIPDQPAHLLHFLAESAPMLALFSNRRRVLVAFAILSAASLASLLVLFNII